MGFFGAVVDCLNEEEKKVYTTWARMNWDGMAREKKFYFGNQEQILAHEFTR